MDAMTPETPAQILGRHVLLELTGASGLNDPARLEAALRGAADAAGATVVQVVVHRFAPQGVSGVAILAESHISAHTWPEIGYGAFDIYTCGSCDPEAGARHLQVAFEASGASLRVVDRGPSEDCVS